MHASNTGNLKGVLQTTPVLEYNYRSTIIQGTIQLITGTTLYNFNIMNLYSLPKNYSEWENFRESDCEYMAIWQCLQLFLFISITVYARNSFDHKTQIYKAT